MNPTVRIMMATYNGEKYLSQQLDSIISQTYKNWSLIIQDDGSKDNTWSILEKYASQESRVAIRKSQEEKHGAYYNFHSIANQEKQSGIKYDYYMFCDQDDVWDEDKIEQLLASMDNRSDIPLFSYADMRVIDENGSEQMSSLCAAQGLSFINNESLFFSHIVYGCNTIMNRTAFMAVPIIDTTQEWVGILSHDNLYAKFSGLLGKVNYIPKTTMGYRRHGANVTSKHTYGFGMKRIVRRVLSIQDLAKDHARTYNQSLIALRFLKELKTCRNNDIDDITKVIKKGGFFSYWWIRKKGISWGNRIKDISHKTIILVGLYKEYLMDV